MGNDHEVHDGGAKLSTRPRRVADLEITGLLEAWSSGDPQAAAEVVPRVYDQLRRVASRCFRRERAGHTLQATAIVHEAYLALAGQKGLRWRSRDHFFGIAARLMRRILVNHARERDRIKRGGGRQRVTLLEAEELLAKRRPDLVAVDDALRSLASIDRRKADLVELRFFGGLTLEEAASLLGVSRATAAREWQRARAWLYRELSRREAPMGPPS